MVVLVPSPGVPVRTLPEDLVGWEEEDKVLALELQAVGVERILASLTLRLSVAGYLPDLPVRSSEDDRKLSEG